MFTKTKNKRVVLMIFLLSMIVGGGAFLWLTHATNSEAGFVLAQNYLDQENTIQYIGNVDDTGAPFGMVMYDASNPESLRHYAEVSRLQGQKLIDTRLSWKEFVNRFQIDGGPGGPFWYVEDFGLDASDK